MDPADTTRRIRPRRGLPSGRALLGALLITTAVVATFALVDNAPTPAVDNYAVVVRDLAVGATIGPGDVETHPADLPAEVGATIVRRPDHAAGATVLRPLHAGELLDERDLRPADDFGDVESRGAHELTIPVAVERAPSALQPGDRVTVLAFDEGDRTLVTAVEDGRVLRFDPAPATLGGAGGARLTLAIDDPGDVLAVTRASYSSLTVVLTTNALADRYGNEPIGLEP